jgi:hypothetical protein
MTSRQGLRPIKDIIKLISKPIVENFGFKTADIIDDWESIVGKELAQYTQPIKLNYNNKKRGTLHIAADNSSIALELKYHEYIILEKLAKLFGHNTIDSIYIRLSKISNPPTI